MVNNIENNAINEISAKKGLNTLNKLKNAGIKTPKQKELLDLFNNLLDTILTDKTLMSSKDKNEKEKENGNKNDEALISSKDHDDDDNKSENEETLMSSKDENKNAKIKKAVPVPKKQ